MNIIKKTTHNYIHACSMCHVSSNQLDKAKGSQKADKLNHAWTALTEITMLTSCLTKTQTVKAK